MHSHQTSIFGNCRNYNSWCKLLRGKWTSVKSLIRLQTEVKACDWFAYYKLAKTTFGKHFMSEYWGNSVFGCPLNILQYVKYCYIFRSWSSLLDYIMKSFKIVTAHYTLAVPLLITVCVVRRMTVSHTRITEAESLKVLEIKKVFVGFSWF